MWFWAIIGVNSIMIIFCKFISSFSPCKTIKMTYLTISSTSTCSLVLFDTDTNFKFVDSMSMHSENQLKLREIHLPHATMEKGRVAVWGKGKSMHSFGLLMPTSLNANSATTGAEHPHSDTYCLIIICTAQCDDCIFGSMIRTETNLYMSYGDVLCGEWVGL